MLLQDKWTVELLLERLATADNPCFNALIDTGALITGYSNEEVAKQLLERGLAWCDGVVFLDDDDKQQVRGVRPHRPIGPAVLLPLSPLPSCRCILSSST